MGLRQHISSPPSYSMQRIPAPPSAARFDAVFVHAVTDLSAILRDRGDVTRAVTDD